MLTAFFKFSSVKHRVKSNVIKKLWDLDLHDFVSGEDLLDLGGFLIQAFDSSNVVSDIIFALSFFHSIESLRKHLDKNIIKCSTTKRIVPAFAKNRNLLNLFLLLVFNNLIASNGNLCVLSSHVIEHDIVGLLVHTFKAKVSSSGNILVN